MALRQALLAKQLKPATVLKAVALLKEMFKHAIQWLSDNGPQYTATATVLYAHELGLVPITTPAYSPESNGLAEDSRSCTFSDGLKVIPPRLNHASMTPATSACRSHLLKGSPLVAGHGIRKNWGG